MNRAYTLELSGHYRSLGTFDSEKAQTAIDRAQYFRVRANLLVLTHIDVLEEVLATGSVPNPESLPIR